MRAINAAWITILASLVMAAGAGRAEVQIEAFNRDPAWDGLNNRSAAFSPRTIEQDFGYVPANDAGKPAQTIGGVITPDGTGAYYAMPVRERTFNDAFQASGKITVKKGGGNLLLGFFNGDTINEWRTPNTVVFRINGRGDIFHVHVEYATSKWRAGAGVIGRYDSAADRVYPLEIPSDSEHSWSLAYDPAANNGDGAITATFDEQRVVCNLDSELKADGARFNRFGLLNVVKHADGPGTVFVSNLEVDGEAVDLRADPKWTGLHNRTTYESLDVRPRFSFGFSPTNYAGGAAPGEMGGLFFRGDCRYPERLAYYGAKLDVLTLQKPLHASGKLALRRAVSDSTTLFGFFHSEHSVGINPSQSNAYPMDYLGFNIEGPSRDGFFVYPSYRVHGDGQGNGLGPTAPTIYPDGAPHSWTLDYQPPAGGSPGTITVSLDGKNARVAVAGEHASTGAQFNRFGLVTPWIDGNGQVVYFDDLTYTVRQ